MNVLAFDTCFDACSVAFGSASPGDSRCVSAERVLMKTGHAEALMPMIERVMQQSRTAFDEIDTIAITNGPGTFTGTRICVAAARALALATNARIVSFSSLQLIGVSAARATPECAGPDDAVLVARDARRDELYCQVVAGDGEALSEPLLRSAERAAALCPERRLFVVGSGAEAVLQASLATTRTTGRTLVAVDESSSLGLEAREPDASVMLTLVAHALPTPSDAPAPLYLRPADAKPPGAAFIARQPV